VLIGLVLVRNNNNHVTSTNVNANAVYTAEDVNRIVNEALVKQQKSSQPETPPQIVAVQSPKPKLKSSARSQRPLSKVEREQLAAELRLVSSGDDTTLNLLGDRINQ
jgi:hypothetical protein